MPTQEQAPIILSDRSIIINTKRIAKFQQLDPTVRWSLSVHYGSDNNKLVLPRNSATEAISMYLLGYESALAIRTDKDLFRGMDTYKLAAHHSWGSLCKALYNYIKGWDRNTENKNRLEDGYRQLGKVAMEIKDEAMTKLCVERLGLDV
jgi:hypothetical protein